jgi:hypothetical protein
MRMYQPPAPRLRALYMKPLNLPDIIKMEIYKNSRHFQSTFLEKDALSFPFIP